MSQSSITWLNRPARLVLVNQQKADTSANHVRHQGAR